MPLKLGLVGHDGAPVALQLEGANEAPEERVLELTEAEQSFRFVNIDGPVIPSVFRDLSAPVEVSIPMSDADRVHLMKHDPNLFNRWEMGRDFALGLLEKAAVGDGTLSAPDIYFDAMRRTLNDKDLEDDFIAMAFALPSYKEISQHLAVVDPDKIFAARGALARAIGSHLEEDFLKAYDARADKRPFSPDAGSAGRRAVKNRALAFLLSADAKTHAPLAARQFEMADNMTDVMGALEALNHVDVPEREACLDAFYKRWADDPIVIDKWLRLQATSSLSSTFETVQSLESDPVFDIRRPNKVYALILAFVGANLVRFHDAGGAPYAYFTDRVLQLDRLNPEVAARLMSTQSAWRRFEPGRKALLKAQLRHIAETEGLSPNLFEIVTKTLGSDH